MNVGDEILELDEAAQFMRVSPSWLAASDVPRASLGRDGKRGRVLFLRSQLIAYVASRLTHRIDDPDERRTA